jgi:hypothetical protein
MMAPNPAAMQGAIAQEAAICETLDFFQPQLTGMLEAIPTPTRAPTIDCVVLTGKPSRVQTVNHVAEPEVILARAKAWSERSIGTNFSNDVGEDQDTRRLQERCNGEDPTANGRGNPLTQSDRANEFCDARETSCLDESQGFGADWGCVGICDIIGANTPDGEQEEDDTNGEEPVEIVHFRHGCLGIFKNDG